MKLNYKIFNVLLLAFVSFTLINCAGDGEAPEQIDHSIAAQLTSPSNDATFTVGNPVDLNIKVNKPEGISNLAIYINEVLYKGDLTAESQTVQLVTDSTSKVGKYSIKFSYTDAEGKTRADYRDVYFFSDITPTQKTAEMLSTYPHAKTSYTQGLEFYKGKLFEGTGQYNQSVLAEVELTTGTKLREIPLEGTTFGEGITLLNDKIYQITYRKGECYVYDLDFNLLNTFTYDGEGWGLCNDGKSLIMSNGSSKIVWRNPETFAIERSIEVFDDRISVGNLNELELINGSLFMNLYTENRIAEVDTATGKVIAYVDCQAIATAGADPGNDVLNGIAYNPETGKIYMTGKWWPKLFEVRFN
jgi:glutaminyl-peptide cyclotransferase